MRRLRPTRLLRSPTTWLVLFAATAALAGTAVAGAVWSGTDAESTALRAAGGLSAATTALGTLSKRRVSAEEESK